MNMRERMLAVVRGGELDRVPFVQYGNVGGPNEDIWARIGRDNMGVLRWCGVHAFQTPNCRIDTEEISCNGQKGWRNTLLTPAGSLTEEKVLVPEMGGVQGFAKHYVERVEDYAVLLAYYRDIEVVENSDAVRAAIGELGDDGLPHVSLERTPFQNLWIQWVSVMDLSLHMVDAPEIVDECLAAIGDVLLRVADVAWRAAGTLDLPYVIVPDNVTAPLIGEPRFREYCAAYYRRIADRMADRNVPLYVHMDGDLKPLWDAICASGVTGLDSLSPPPDNDTSVAEALALRPDMRVLVNFPSSVHIAEPEEIYRRACEILEQGGHSGRLQIQVSENMPRGAWETSYPQIVRAIADFGRP